LLLIIIYFYFYLISLVLFIIYYLLSFIFYLLFIIYYYLFIFILSLLFEIAARSSPPDLFLLFQLPFQIQSSPITGWLSTSPLLPAGNHLPSNFKFKTDQLLLSFLTTNPHPPSISLPPQTIIATVLKHHQITTSLHPFLCPCTSRICNMHNSIPNRASSFFPYHPHHHKFTTEPKLASHHQQTRAALSQSQHQTTVKSPPLNHLEAILSSPSAQSKHAAINTKTPINPSITMPARKRKERDELQK
jgi:hypothetical protein